jgi:choline dehydrogenase-like flavoprotein
VALERPPFTTASRRRVAVDDVYTAPTRADAEVRDVLLDGRRAVGVRLINGEEVEAATVVVSAGAIHTPALLMRAGVDRPGLGGNLQDHPAARVVVDLPPDERVPDRRRLPFGVVGRKGAIQFVPMDYTDDLATGGVTVALMDAHARGRVVLTDEGRPDVRFEQFADDRDRAALAGGLATVKRMLPTAVVPAVDDLGDVFHAAGTCRMGDPADPEAVVDGRGRVIGYEGLRVADASVMPTLPEANPMLTCLAIGERLAERW